MIRPRITTLALVLGTVACGAYGPPLPPLQLLPPEPPQLMATQHGTDAILRFDPLPASVMTADGVLADLERIDILVLSQRYPAVTADVLALLLDRERRERLEAAQTAVADAETAAAERQRDAERAAAIAAAEEAGLEPPVFEDPVVELAVEEPEDDEIPLTEDEIAIRRLPSTVRQAWREGNVSPGTVLEAAERLDQAVDDLWNYLDMPTAIVDVRRPPRLPDPVLVVAAAERVARTLNYETEMEVELFEAEAEVVASIPVEEIGNYLRGGMVQFSHPVGVPAAGAIRTRYFFALRAVTTRGRESTVERVVALAPSAVPLAPTALESTVLESGVYLTWEAPSADLLGTEIPAEEIEYNVYRLPASTGPTEATRITPVPLTQPMFLDTAMDWNDRHVYEVRAMVRPPSLEDEVDTLPTAISDPAALAAAAAAEAAALAARGPRKESVSVTSEAVRVEDIFAPPAVYNLVAVRAASRVTLRWSERSVGDQRGYRVYRHAAPAPDLPGPVPGLIYPATAAPAAPAGAVAETVEDPDAVVPQEPEGETGPARRQLRNQLTTDGWEMLTPVIISENRFIDTLSDSSVTWVYVVEVVDESGNVSLPAMTILLAEERP